MAITLELRSYTETRAGLGLYHYWHFLSRGIIIFPLADLHDIEDLSSITEAKIRIYGKSKTDTGSLAPTINVYQASPAESDDLNNTDYNAVGDTPWSTAIAYGDFPTSGWAEFILNSDGLTAFKYHLLVNDSYMAFALRNANYDVANVQPAWASGVLTKLEWATTETDGETYAPQLIVKVGAPPYEPPPTPPTPIYSLNGCDMSDLELSFGEREIYNDIRAECDLTAILELRPDATPDYFTTFTAEAYIGHANPVAVGETRQIIASVNPDHTNIQWLNIVPEIGVATQMGMGEAECDSLGGSWHQSQNESNQFCMLPREYAEYKYREISRTATTFTIEIENTGDYELVGWFDIEYLAVSPETRYVKLRSIDDTSIEKYGRRVMNLVWQLGITPLAMQGLIDDYCERYAEPVVFARLTLIGKTDTLISRILDTHIDDAITLTNSDLELDHDFWVNQVQIIHRVDGLLEGLFELEQVRS